MMIRALAESSDLQATICDATERRIRSREIDSDYNPNPNGYMHAPNMDLADCPDETLAKVSIFRITSLPLTRDARVVFMQRNMVEARISYARAFGMPYPEDHLEMANYALTYLYGHPKAVVAVVDYADALARPLKVFEALREDGWPIISALAAATVDPTLYRNQIP